MAMIEQPAAKALTAREEERFFARDRRGRFWSRSRFLATVVVVLLVHAALLAYFLYRDNNATVETAQIEETPVEVIVEKPEPPKPPPPPPPPQEQKKPQPKPKEEIEKPAFSAPRAPNKETVETKQQQQKTEAPKAPTPPKDGRPEPAKEASLPKDQATPDTIDQTAPKPADEKPDAEALDKAKPETKKKPDAKEAKTKPAPKKPATKDAMSQLAGLSNMPNFSFAAPTPKSPVYGGTEDVRYLAIVQGLIMQKVRQLPRLSRYQEGGQVAVFFHIDDAGRVISQDILKKSGNPEIDRMAMDAVRQASPFPPPPRVVPHDLVWGSSIDGQLPIHGLR